MTPSRRAAANRENARASTGPRTERGKALASRNSRRHGLCIAVFSDPRLSQQAEDLAHEIAGAHPSPSMLEGARAFAEAQIDLDRIRHARHHALLLALETASANQRSDSPLSEIELILKERIRLLKLFDRYERRALGRRRSAMKELRCALK